MQRLPPPPGLSIQVARTSLDLLDTLSVGVILDNPGRKPTTLRFPQPGEYTIEVLRGSSVVWSSSPKPIESEARYPIHTHEVLPGAQRLATYVWNELASDGSSPLPGEYTIRVRLNTVGAQPTAITKVRFAHPTPISALDALKLGDEITLAGHLDASQRVLTDPTGSTTLTRRIRSSTSDTIVVRGYIAAGRDGKRYLAITRWAPERE